jgi:hypothetical protein
MSDEDESSDNVIQVNFGQPRPKKAAPGKAKVEPKYDVDEFEPDPQASKKLEVFSKFIEESKVALTFNTRWPGVKVPKHLRDQNMELTLNFSLRFFIEDFTYDEHAVCATLSFGGEAFYCVVPWAPVRVIFCHATGEVAVFEESI